MAPGGFELASSENDKRSDHYHHRLSSLLAAIALALITSIMVVPIIKSSSQFEAEAADKLSPIGLLTLK